MKDRTHALELFDYVARLFLIRVADNSKVRTAHFQPVFPLIPRWSRYSRKQCRQHKKTFAHVDCFADL